LQLKKGACSRGGISETGGEGANKGRGAKFSINGKRWIPKGGYKKKNNPLVLQKRLPKKKNSSGRGVPPDSLAKLKVGEQGP